MVLLLEPSLEHPLVVEQLVEKIFELLKSVMELFHFLEA
jgi:hypothetical protein